MKTVTFTETVEAKTKLDVLVGGKLWGTLGSGAGWIKAKIGTGSLEIRPFHPKQKEPEQLLAKPELV